MKIGILICGEVPDALKQEYGDYGQRLIREFGLTKEDDIHLFNAHSKELPEMVELCDTYIISGSPSSVLR